MLKFRHFVAGSLLVSSALAGASAPSPAPSASPAPAPGSSESTFEVQGKSVVFSWDPNSRLLLSAACRTGKGYGCEAFSLLRQLGTAGKIPQAELAGGVQPGAVLCSRLPDTQVVIGRDPSGNENHFCRCLDGSMIDIGTLTYYGDSANRKQLRALLAENK